MQEDLDKNPKIYGPAGPATGQDAPDADRSQPPAEDGKNPAAVALGRLGGLKGGLARAQKLTPEERQEIARKAAEARWKKDVGNEPVRPGSDG